MVLIEKCEMEKQEYRTKVIILSVNYNSAHNVSRPLSQSLVPK
jgi:hypothetical protein